MKTIVSDKKLGLYIHIPFCVQKCLYCDFCSYTQKNNDIINSYASRVCDDLRAWGEKCGEYKVDTVYFGGGTPTLLPMGAFARITETLRKSFSVLPSAEVSCECNPATADLDYFRTLHSLGVNRLSIGLQSVHDEELRALGRIHTYSDFLNTYDSARKAGLENISADLMYGIPNQSLDSFRKTLETLISLAPEHISAYGLKIEEGTPFGKMKDSLVLPGEDTEFEMYMLLTNLLADSGYAKYEISNFSHRGRESRHNIKYWKGEDYLGLGVSAHSYFEGVRFANSRDVNGYIEGRDITESRMAITDSEKLSEFIMLRMRLSEGISHSEFKALFGMDFVQRYKDKLAPYIKNGFLVSNGENTFFSDKGFFVSNYILSDIIDFD